MFRVLVTDHPWPELDVESRLLSAAGAVLVDAPDASEAMLSSLAASVDAIATCWGRVTSRVIAAAGRCRLIARYGIGLDNIDVAAATAAGILVTNVPDYCVEEVADHAWGLALSLARNIPWFDRALANGVYNLSAAPPMSRLRGRVLGLLGYGRIGRAIAARAHAFGLRVMAHTRRGNSQGDAVAMVSFEHLLEASDILILQVPLSDQTRHIIDAPALARIKPSALLINTSRGGLIDERALLDSLESGRLAGVGLDVFEQEPPDLASPLLRHPRVVATPHAAFVSVEAVLELRTRVAGQILEVLEGRIPQNVINPDIRTLRSPAGSCVASR